MSAACAFGLAVVYPSVPWLSDERGGFGPTPSRMFGLALLTVVVAVAFEVIQALIMRRRQPDTSAGLLEADDALRSHSLSVLAGITIAVDFFICGSLWMQLGTRTDLQVLRWAAQTVGFSLVVVGMLAFVRLTKPHFPWQVRRYPPAADPA